MTCFRGASRSRNRGVRRSTLIALIALVAAAVPGVAGAAYYADRREATGPGRSDLHIEITTRGRFVTGIVGVAPAHCRGTDGRARGIRFGFTGIRARIRSDGRFRWTIEQSDDGNTGFDGLIGRVTHGGKRIRARFASRFNDVPEGITCWTGASFKDPWVRFVAQRQRRP